MATGDILSEVEAHAESARLLRVRQLIEALLTEYDFCADVVLLGRGRLEVFTHLDASWSVIRLEKDGDDYILRLKSKKENYPSSEAQSVAIRATAGMARSLMEIHYGHLNDWMQASTYIDEKVGAVHSDLIKVKDQGPMQ